MSRYPRQIWPDASINAISGSASLTHWPESGTIYFARGSTEIPFYEEDAGGIAMALLDMLGIDFSALLEDLSEAEEEVADRHDRKGKMRFLNPGSEGESSGS